MSELSDQAVNTPPPGRVDSYLTVCVDGGPQQFPGASSSVHAQHPQDLQEAQAAQGRGQHIALVTHRHHRHRGNQHEDVWDGGDGESHRSFSVVESQPTQFNKSSLWRAEYILKQFLMRADRS